jgi:amino acid transporter
VFSIGGNLAGSMLAAPRILFALAENRQLPAWFARVHERHATPHNAILVMGAMALALGLSSNFLSLAVGSSVVRLLGYIVCIAALPKIRNNADDETRRDALRLPGGYAIPIVALGVCVWLVAQSKVDDWIRVSVLLVVGLALYVLENYLWARRSEQ